MSAEYLRLEKVRDVIELPIEGELDINGWMVTYFKGSGIIAGTLAAFGTRLIMML